MKQSPQWFSAEDPQSSATLRLQNASFVSEEGRPVLQDCTAVLPKTGVFRFAGETDSDTAAVVRVLSGMIACQSGSIHWGQQEVSSLEMQNDSRWRLSCALALKNGGLLSNQSLLSNIAFPLIYHGWDSEAGSLRLAQEYLQVAGVTEHDALKLPAWSSASTQKLCLLVRALIAQPQILILDEPLEGLSPAATESFLKILQWHQQNRRLRLVLIGSEDASRDRDMGVELISMQSGKFVSKSWRMDP